MRALLHTAFAALLARADVSQAAFARISGYTPRQVNTWARGRAALGDRSRHGPATDLTRSDPDHARGNHVRHETLGVPPNADPAALRRAMARLALIYHPDKGGHPDLMRRVNGAYERARRDRSR